MVFMDMCEELLIQSHQQGRGFGAKQIEPVVWYDTQTHMFEMVVCVGQKKITCFDDLTSELAKTTGINKVGEKALVLRLVDMQGITHTRKC